MFFFNGRRDAEYCVGGGLSKVGQQQKKQVVAHPVKLTKSQRVPDVDNYLPPFFFKHKPARLKHKNLKQQERRKKW